MAISETTEIIAVNVWRANCDRCYTGISYPLMFKGGEAMTIERQDEDHYNGPHGMPLFSPVKKISILAFGLSLSERGWSQRLGADGFRLLCPLCAEKETPPAA